MVNATDRQDVFRIGRAGDVVPRIVAFVARTDTNDDAFAHGNVGSEAGTAGLPVNILIGIGIGLVLICC